MIAWEKGHPKSGSEFAIWSDRQKSTAIAGAALTASFIAAGQGRAMESGAYATIGTRDLASLNWFPLLNGATPTQFTDSLTNAGIIEGAALGLAAVGILSGIRAFTANHYLERGNYARFRRTQRVFDWATLGLGIAAVGVGAYGLITADPNAHMMFDSSNFNPGNQWYMNPINGATIHSIGDAARNGGLDFGLAATGIVSSVVGLRRVRKQK